MKNDRYLVELRIGYPRLLIKEGIKEIGKRYNLNTESPETGHMSIYGSFRMKKGIPIKAVREKIESSVKNFQYIRYTIDGFACKKGDNGWAIAYHIIPSKELREFNELLRPRLWGITEDIPQYMKKDPKNEWYHITIAFKLYDSKKNKIINDLGPVHMINENGQCYDITTNYNQSPVIKPLFIPIDCLRITILHGSKIDAEFDLTSRRWLSREYALDATVLGNTLRRHRRYSGLEITQPKWNDTQSPHFVSDLHLGHLNVVKTCARPFLYTYIKEMDDVLINNWNCVVQPQDTVYYLGDLSLHQFHSSVNYLKILNGNINFIEGNHDCDNSIPSMMKFKIIEYNSIKFYLIHDPSSVPEGFNGWIIHGHKHNSDLKNFPLINFKTKRINISAELTNYQPIRLDYLYHLMMNNTQNILYLDGNRGYVLDDLEEKSSLSQIRKEDNQSNELTSQEIRSVEFENKTQKNEEGLIQKFLKFLK